MTQKRKELDEQDGQDEQDKNQSPSSSILPILFSHL